MLWRLLAMATYGCRVPVTYEGDASDRTEVGPLDPIDPAIVGSARIDLLHQYAKREGLTVLERGLAAIAPGGPESDIRKEILAGAPQEPTTHPRVGKKYAEHMIELERVGILRPAHKIPLRFLSGYFTVPKADKARAIFNGKGLSRCCPAPQPVNLAETRELIRRIAAVVKRHGRVCVVAGDFRHWFHQIRASPELQRLFGMSTERGRFFWSSLPMGWSWSPFFAQCAAWGFLFYREAQQKALLDESVWRTSSALPRFVPTRSGKGFATVYYDNFLLITPDWHEATEFDKRIRLNSANLGVHIKVGSEVLLDESGFVNEGFTYLGVTYQGFKQRPEHRQLEGFRYWPAKVAEWRQEDDAVRKKREATCRGSAETLGRVLFACLLSHEGMTSIAAKRTLRLLRPLGRTAFENGWDSPSPTPSHETGALWRWLTDLHANPFVHYRDAPATETTVERVLATDASSSGYGWVLLRRREGAWSEELPCLRHAYRFAVADTRHIYLKEMETALAALRWYAQAYGRDAEQVTLVVDNAAVAFSLRNRVTNSNVGMDMMEQTEEVLALMKDVILVVSEDNPADCPSRGEEKGFQERVANIPRSIDAFERGWQWSSKKAADWIGEWSSLRHIAPTDGDEVQEAG